MTTNKNRQALQAIGGDRQPLPVFKHPSKYLPRIALVGAVLAGGAAELDHVSHIGDNTLAPAFGIQNPTPITESNNINKIFIRAPKTDKNGNIIASKTGQDIEIVFSSPKYKPNNKYPSILGAFANDVYLSTPHKGGNRITNAMNDDLTNQAEAATNTNGAVTGYPTVYYANVSDGTKMKTLEELAAVQDTDVIPFVAPSK